MGMERSKGRVGIGRRGQQKGGTWSNRTRGAEDVAEWSTYRTETYTRDEDEREKQEGRGVYSNRFHSARTHTCKDGVVHTNIETRSLS